MGRDEGQPGRSGIMVDYTGGDTTGAIPGAIPFTDRTTNGALGSLGTQFLAQIGPVFPGLDATWNGKATLSLPDRDQNFRCSYSYWRIGQYQRYGGYGSVRQGDVHFAGEHTSQNFQGFMEGGAETGVAAAEEVIADLG